ncbi:hypothetical protein [Clostridium thailandense]|uniref:hypothetical protein n=1 Tax=Clostridium thailandense TaxID=2794346 RepID=UPI0039894D04
MGDNVIEVNNRQVAVDDDQYAEKGYVRLPFTNAEFTEFITGLLGEPQSLDGVVLGKFIIDASKVESLFYLINERANQNAGKLISFTAKIAYNDKSAVTLNSLNDFITYNELKKVVPSVLHLSWTYLIQFPGKTVPEKQKIRLAFKTQAAYNKYSAFEYVAGISSDILKGGVVEYKIEHTYRSWGVDIENILVNQIKQIIENPRKIQQSIAKHKGKIAIISSAAITSGILSIPIRAIYHLQDKELSIANGKVKELGTNLNGKLDYLINYIASSSQDKYSILLFSSAVVSLIMFLFILFYIIDKLDIGDISYILLTEESRKIKAQDECKEKKRWLMIIGTLIMGILTGVLGNFVYAYLIR